MGEQKVSKGIKKKDRARFIGHLLNDIKALEQMLDEGIIEDDIVRIGSEQEFCLVTETWRPSDKNEEILAAIDDPHFTTELARYNLEINLDPIELKDDCFTEVATQLDSLLQKAKEVASKFNTKVVLTGILPTISNAELEYHYMTPQPRYWALNNMLKEVRGDDFQLHIKGVDELSLKHDSVLFEACNTSFQMHLQIPPQDFISSYNWAQAISGPILGISTNSPLLLGRELWNETRIALFQQSIDTRYSSYALKDQQARVSFGTAWESGSIAEIFKNDIAQHKVILSKDIDRSSVEQLSKGIIPKLPALNLHNGTIYKWNRPCYGVGGGKPHVRIENRYIASGPSTLDEMATFAFWVGLMIGRPKKFDNMELVMDFRDAKANFIKAARTGKYSVLNWMGKHYSVKDLVLKELLPIARKGLIKARVNPEDIAKYLEIIETRAHGITGSEWLISNYRTLRRSMKKDDALRILTKNSYENQERGHVVNDWPNILEHNPQLDSAHLVGHIMSTQLFTVHENDLANLATHIMEWKGIHHVPVENQSGKLCGLLTWTHMLKYKKKEDGPLLETVADIMVKNITTISSGDRISDAIHLMKKNGFGCLPVVKGKELIGIITIKDVIAFANGNASK
ncbi:MAG: CBS domain-containing protein [Altibacter sp.]|uniref:CBS domain-containing protein n=1 Tax=Altibacter sp. TaxID=2024823 RepID=UPI001D740A4D|nr:CBS domain-containing protein [Altibacter sp.]MBZ0326867.1 CBS domain-containing protein [Altibacter sp.]